MSKSEPHPEDIGRKAAAVHFTDEDLPVVYDHVDPHDGYLFARKDGEVSYIPWHRIHEVVRDA